MSKYPIRYLPVPVREAFTHKLLGDGYVNILPYQVKIRGEKVYTYYSPPKNNCTTFVVEVNLETKECIVHTGEYGGQYAERLPDRDKKQRPLDKGKAIIKGYVVSSGRASNYLADVEVLFHPSQTLKPLPEVKIDERERRILFCFGSLKEGLARREALHRLNVSKPELEVLVNRGLLKKIGNSHGLTMIAEANRLPRPVHGEKVIVDQW